MVIDAGEAEVLERARPQGLEQTVAQRVSTSSSPRRHLFEQIAAVACLTSFGTRQ